MEQQEEVKNIFKVYLETKGYRKTPERFAILEEIYTKREHLDVETLYYNMIERNYRVSRATVYNTIELLLNCNLVVKHQFTNNTMQIEKSYGYRQHDHLICLDCKKVVEFCDPRIQSIKSSLETTLETKISHHSLMLYGKCQKTNCENLKKDEYVDSKEK